VRVQQGDRLATLLFTDIEGSTRRWEDDPETMDVALARHDAILREAVHRYDGEVTKSTGDGLLALFTQPAAGVEAAVSAQVALLAEPWSGSPIRVRMGLHTGVVRPRDQDVFGRAVNLAARIEDAGHGGQILLSSTTYELVRHDLPPGVTAVDLGHWALRGIHVRQHLFQLLAPGLPSAFPRLRASRPVRSVLPTVANRYIDPNGEVGRITAALAGGRCVTVVGPGGVGKSRLAVETTARLEDAYLDGARWCPLASVDDPERVAAAVAAQLDLGSAVVTADGILDALGDLELLLVLDNCEHVLGAARDLADRIVAACPGVSILATSREPLRVAGEQVLELSPLAARSAGDAAVELFLDRAGSAGARLDDVPAVRERVAELCRRIDGLPLAIELAAARTRSLGLAEIERRLDQRFLLLASRQGPGTGTPAHHQTLEATVGWSYDLLGPRQRMLFTELSVFRDGCTAEAVEAVCTGTPEGWVALEDLADRSLLHLEPTGPVTRYEMLETVRAFARERLDQRGDLAAVAERHARYFCDLAERADVARAGPDEADWVERELSELANLRAAGRWAMEHDDVDLALRLFVAIYELASLQGHVEIFDWLEPAQFIDSGHELVAAALAMSGLRQDPARPASAELAEQAIELQHQLGLRPHRILPWAKGFAEASRGNRAAAHRAYSDAVDLIRELEGENGHWISARALVVMLTRDGDEARAVVDDGERVGQPSGLANALLALARVVENDDPRSALELTRRAFGLAGTVQNTRLLAYADLTAAGIASRHATTAVAVGHLLAALQFAVQVRHHEAMWRAIVRLDEVLARAGFSDTAGAVAGLWVGAFPTPARRYPSLVARAPGAAMTGRATTPTVGEVAAATGELVEQLRRDGLLGRPAGEDLAEERRAGGG
jgi:predicted ATPase/class 3 adenylate cyclase